MKTLAAKILKIVGVFILLSIVLVAGVSCKKQTKKTSYSGPEYLAFGFSDKYNPLNPKEQSKTKSKFYLKPGTSFKGTYGIGNHFPKKSSYHIVALLDYKQIPISLDGSNNLIQKLTLAPNQQKLSKFKTPEIKKGFHDFLIIIFKDLNNHNVLSKYRFSEIFFEGIRSNFIVGDYKKRDYPYTYFSRIAYRTDLEAPLFINQNREEFREWTKSKIKTGQKANYFVHLSNNTKHKKDYVLIVFLDAKQIAIQGHKVIHTTVEPKTRMVIPADVNFGKKDKGRTAELMVVAIDSPGLPMDDEATKALPGYDEAILESNRVALFVE